MAAIFRTRLGEPCLKTYPLECVDLLRRARVAFQAGRTLKEGFRLAQLEAVVRMLEEHECDFVDALGRDLHKVRTMFVLDYDNENEHNGPNKSFLGMFVFILYFVTSHGLRQLCQSWFLSRTRRFMPSTT